MFENMPATEQTKRIKDEIRATIRSLIDLKNCKSKYRPEMYYSFKDKEGFTYFGNGYYDVQYEHFPIRSKFLMELDEPTKEVYILGLIREIYAKVDCSSFVRRIDPNLKLYYGDRTVFNYNGALYDVKNFQEVMRLLGVNKIDSECNAVVEQCDTYRYKSILVIHRTEVGRAILIPCRYEVDEENYTHLTAYSKNGPCLTIFKTQQFFPDYEGETLGITRQR